MPGRQNVLASRGSSYEDFVQTVLGRLATMVHVPRQHDFGIDFYCQPRIPSGQRTESVTDLCSIQVKGGDSIFGFGGLKRRSGQWRDYHFDWLRSLAIPIFLARVDKDFSAVELFSLWPLWLVFWQTSTPFSVTCRTKPATSTLYELQDLEKKISPVGQGKGDGCDWVVDLGPPFLRLTLADLNDDGFSDGALAILQQWIRLDRETLIRFHLRVAVVEGIYKYSTNFFSYSTKKAMFWSYGPGANVVHLSRTMTPMIVNLGVHLQWQNNEAAYLLIPVIEWLNREGHLDEMGQGLLDGLRESRAEGKGPAPMVSGDPL